MYPPQPQPVPWPLAPPQPYSAVPAAPAWDPYATAVERPIDEMPLDELCAEYAAVSRSIEATRTQRDALTEALTERRARRHALAVALPARLTAEHGVDAPDTDQAPAWDLDSPEITHRRTP